MRAGMNLNKPLFVLAKMTMRCNSRCSHCNIWDMDFAEQELTTGQWLKALDRLRRWLGGFNMVFTGGEALLREDMLHILEHATGIGIHVELLSNGLMIDDSLARRLVDSGIDQITISMDGFLPATHDRFRGKTGSHEMTTTAIMALKKQREVTGKSLRILLKTVISGNNLDELVEIAHWARSHGLEVQYQPIEQNYGEAHDPQWFRKSALWIDDIRLLRTEIEKLIELRMTGAPIVNSVDDLTTFVRYFDQPEELMDSIQSHDTRTTEQHCRHALTNFVISSNGDVRMCFKMAPIGNIALQSPEEIWKTRERCWTRPCKYRKTTV